MKMKVEDCVLYKETEVGRDEMVEKYFEYLDALRLSGVTNMFGAGQYLEIEFGLNKGYARTVLSEWMRTFGERHKD